MAHILSHTILGCHWWASGNAKRAIGFLGWVYLKFNNCFDNDGIFLILGGF